MMMFWQISNYMSNGEMAVTVAIMLIPFLLVAAGCRWPIVTAILLTIAFIFFVGIPIAFALKLLTCP